MGADADERSLERWKEFLYSYAHGQFSSTAPPLSPSTIASRSSPLCEDYQQLGIDLEHPVYTTVEITTDVAKRVRGFYEKTSVLPPPRAPLESLREQVILEYDLYSESQTQSFQRATDLVQAFFGGICTFTMFRSNVQELRAASGPQEVLDNLGLVAGTRLLPETSLCGHSVLQPDGCFYIPDLAKDWRYSGNPYADVIKGIKSYVGRTVSLNVDPSEPTETDKVPVGVINLMHLDTHLPALTADQQKLLEHVRRMLETQLMATWEGHARSKEAQARRAVSRLLESEHFTLHSSSQSAMLNSAQTAALSKQALQYAREVLPEITCIHLVDLRVLVPIDQTGRPTYILGQHANRVLPLIARHCVGDQLSEGASGYQADMVINFLTSYAKRPLEIFNGETGSSGLEASLPTDSQSHAALPFFAGDQPLFLLVASVSRFSHVLQGGDTNFLRSLGHILRAQILQARVIEADAAKTRFMSSISHELRTPMHGVLSNLQLLHDAFESGDLAEAKILLGHADVSGHALQRILNDVLDFGSITQGRLSLAKNSVVDLGSVILSVARICQAGMNSVKQNKVEIRVVMEERDWTANIDDAGFQRILFNGMTNAIKFTDTGRITLSLISSPDNASVTCTIQDTGKGISPAFQLAMFEPFTKADPFTPGAGLGLYIVRTLASRMGGKIALEAAEGGGTLFTATLPVILLGPRPVTPSLSQKIIHTDSHGPNQNQPPDVDVSSLEIGTRAQPAKPTTPEVSSSPSTTSASASLTDRQVGGTPRILVVDDNEIGRRILVKLLKQISRHYPVDYREAEDGLDAIEVFTEYKPHVVLTDVSMPRMDGITSASEMRKIEAESIGLKTKSKIYAITGLGSSDPRLTTDALHGAAELDGWLIKGEAKLAEIREIVDSVKSELSGELPSPS